MKITLISTLIAPSDQGLRTISSVLKKEGHNVNIVFMVLNKDYSKLYSKKELSQLREICRNSELIGVSAFTSTAPRAIQIIEFLELIFPEKNIILGGVHATLFPEDCIKHSKIVCIGEGEEAIIDLVNTIEAKKSIDKIKNLWIRKRDRIIKNPIRPLIENLDKLPFLDFELNDHFILDGGTIRKFQEKDLKKELSFLTGRGCPYGCDYCSNNLFNQIYKGKCKTILRWHSPKYIIDCALYLKNKFPQSFKFFDIRDDSFFLRPINQIKEFCKDYKIKVGINFKCIADPRTVTEEKVKLLVEAGCTDISMGIEGCERVNKEIYHRNMTDEQVINAANILNKYKDKMSVSYEIITSNPYETPEDIINLIRLIQKIPKPYRPAVNNLVFFPNTVLYKRAVEDGIIKSYKDTGSNLDYNDRAKHILLKKKNIYLNLIVNLMRGVAIENKIGIIPDSMLNYLLEEKRIKRNLNNPGLAITLTRGLIIYDFIKYKIFKKLYSKAPLFIKNIYIKIKYGGKIYYTEQRIDS